MDFSREKAVVVLGLGCFWGAQRLFKRVKGVTHTKVGFSGGHLSNPTYEEVYTDQTGHAEVVWVEYDPDEITYEKVIKKFFVFHDPTEIGGQKGDRGTRYRSVIFYESQEQQEICKAILSQENQRYKGRVVTALEPLENFYPAEEYHQDYLDKHRWQGVIAGYNLLIYRLLRDFKRWFLNVFPGEATKKRNPRRDGGA